MPRGRHARCSLLVAGAAEDLKAKALGKVDAVVKVTEKVRPHHSALHSLHLGWVGGWHGTYTGDIHVCVCVAKREVVSFLLHAVMVVLELRRAVVVKTAGFLLAPQLM